MNKQTLVERVVNILFSRLNERNKANKAAMRNFMRKKGEGSSTATYGTARDKPGDVDLRRARRDLKLGERDPYDVALTARSNRERAVRGH